MAANAVVFPAKKKKSTSAVAPKRKPAQNITVARDPKKSKKRKAQPHTITREQFERLTVIQQIKRSLSPGARMAGVTGLLIGGFIPAATYILVHHEVTIHPFLWLLVAGGLLYSALTVYAWSSAAFGSMLKAIGFCVLLEGTLTFSTIFALSFAALLVLVFVNAVSAACSLQIRKDTVTA